MISFSTNVKIELSSIDGTDTENIAELSAFIRNNYKNDLKIELVTENSKIARRLYTLFKNIYNVSCEINDKNNSFNRNRLYVVTLNEKVIEILRDLSIIDSNNNYLDNVEDYIVDSEDEKRAYLKGVFLATGSINDPKTSRYHLEFFIDKYEEALFINNLLNEFYLNSKIIQKDKKYMIYVKEAEKIGDFLRIINASQAVLYYEDIRIYRDHKNMTNRLNNMEQANIEKTIAMCNSQIEDIELIFKELGEQFLDEKTLLAAQYRLKYTESSLQELSEIMSLEVEKPITKSGLNHRFRKIRQLADNIRNLNNNV